MNRLKLSNISLSDFRKFLRYAGCVKADGGDGGHEKWKKKVRVVGDLKHRSPSLIAEMRFP